MGDSVNHPDHYNGNPSGVECIDVVEHMNFNIGNAVKYLWRADLKNGLEDLRKAAWYVNREIERQMQNEPRQDSKSISSERNSGVQRLPPINRPCSCGEVMLDSTVESYGKDGWRHRSHGPCYRTAY